jgi:molybdopterin-guanine dinucleotide biosynthesis protein A
VPGTLGVLVAGGDGSRLGLGIPKALVSVGDATLLARGARTLGAVCDQVVVAAPAALALPNPAAGDDAPGSRSPDRAFDPAGTAGPLAMVLAVDLPLATPPALAALLACLGDHQAVIPAPRGVPQPLAAAYAPSALAHLAAHLDAGERSLTRAVVALDVVWLDDEALARLPGGHENFFNLNTREELMEAGRRLAARGGAR